MYKIEEEQFSRNFSCGQLLTSKLIINIFQLLKLKTISLNLWNQLLDFIFTGTLMYFPF